MLLLAANLNCFIIKAINGETIIIICCHNNIRTVNLYVTQSQESHLHVNTVMYVPWEPRKSEFREEEWDVDHVTAT